MPKWQRVARFGSMPVCKPRMPIGTHLRWNATSRGRRRFSTHHSAQLVPNNEIEVWWRRCGSHHGDGCRETAGPVKCCRFRAQLAKFGRSCPQTEVGRSYAKIDPNLGNLGSVLHRLARCGSLSACMYAANAQFLGFNDAENIAKDVGHWRPKFVVRDAFDTTVSEFL